MSQVCLISGSPGCGKTNWILNTFKNYSGNCGYLRLGGYSEINLEQAINSKIDFAFLKDQIPNLKDLRGNRKKEQKVPQKSVIGIGAGKNYTLYYVGTDNTQFVQAGYKSEKIIKGFGR